MKKRIFICAVSIIIAVTVLLTVLIWNGVILLNSPSEEKYPIRGVDVSSYQGDIDWETLSSQDIDFAFIKATEGSSFVDENFGYNYEQAQKTNLRVGAYHFFSYDSSGETQADNFIKTVEKCDNMLPPVIDVEFYGDKEKNPPEKSDVDEELGIMVQKLYEHYGMNPVIYATEKSYELYISGGYDECDIWIRDVISSPKLYDEREWTFWQYTNRECLKGYSGEEKYIDMNVFNGSLDEFENYTG